MDAAGVRKNRIFAFQGAEKMKQAVYPCIIVDDDSSALHLMTEVFKGSRMFRLIGAFERLGDAIDFARKNKVALMVADIEFPEEGLAYDLLRKAPKELRIAFVSGHGNRMFSGYAAMREIPHVLGMHPKPLTPEMLGWIEDSFVQDLELGGIVLPEPAWFFCYEDKEHTRQRMVSCTDIIMIEMKRTPRALHIYLNSTPRVHYKFSLTLKECFEYLESIKPGAFLLIPRQGIVNKKNVRIEGDYLVPVLRKYSNLKIRMKIPFILMDKMPALIQG